MTIKVNGVDVGNKKFGEIQETYTVLVNNIKYKIVDVEITDNMNNIECHRIAEIDLEAVIDNKIPEIDVTISYYSMDDENMSDIAKTIIKG